MSCVTRGFTSDQVDKMEARQAASIEGKWRKTMWNGASGTVYVSALLALRLEEESRSYKWRGNHVTGSRWSSSIFDWGAVVIRWPGNIADVRAPESIDPAAAKKDIERGRRNYLFYSRSLSGSLSLDGGRNEIPTPMFTREWITRLRPNSMSTPPPPAFSLF